MPGTGSTLKEGSSVGELLHLTRKFSKVVYFVSGIFSIYLFIYVFFHLFRKALLP